jgi:hypothetical protein
MERNELVATATAADGDRALAETGDAVVTA